MYAVIKTGGKQYRVSAGDKLKIEKLAAEVGAGQIVYLRDALRRQFSISRSKKNGKNHRERPAQDARAAGSLSFIYSPICVVQRLDKQSSVLQGTCHTAEREADMIEQVQSCAEARARLRVANAGFEMLLRDKMISGQEIGGPQHGFGERQVVGILRFQGDLLAARGDLQAEAGGGDDALHGGWLRIREGQC